MTKILKDSVFPFNRPSVYNTFEEEIEDNEYSDNVIRLDKNGEKQLRNVIYSLNRAKEDLAKQILTKILIDLRADFSLPFKEGQCVIVKSPIVKKFDKDFHVSANLVNLLTEIVTTQDN